MEVGYDGAEWSESGSSGTTSATIDVEGQLTYGVGFRIGAVVADNVLLYGRLGWIRTNFETTLSVVSPSVTGSVSVDNDLDGFRFGGGVEGMLADTADFQVNYRAGLEGPVLFSLAPATDSSSRRDSSGHAG